jgi:hypothetical protein
MRLNGCSRRNLAVGGGCGEGPESTPSRPPAQVPSVRFYPLAIADQYQALASQEAAQTDRRLRYGVRPRQKARLPVQVLLAPAEARADSQNRA